MRGQLKAWGSWPAESCPRPFPHRPPSGKRTPSSIKHHTQKPNFEVPHVARQGRHVQLKFCTVEEEGEGHPMASFGTAPLFPIHTLFIKFTIIYLHSAHVDSSIFQFLKYMIILRAIPFLGHFTIPFWTERKHHNNLI